MRNDLPGPGGQTILITRNEEMRNDEGTSISDHTEKKASLIHEWAFKISVCVALALILFDPMKQLFTLLLS